MEVTGDLDVSVAQQRGRGGTKKGTGKACRGRGVGFNLRGEMVSRKWNVCVLLLFNLIRKYNNVPEC